MGGGADYRKDTGKKGRVSGLASQMQKRQHEKYIDEVNKPWCSTKNSRNGVIKLIRAS